MPTSHIEVSLALVTVQLLGAVSNKILSATLLAPEGQAVLRYPFSIWLVVCHCLYVTWQPVPNSAVYFDSGGKKLPKSAGTPWSVGM
jgi:hypothetical protein